MRGVKLLVIDDEPGFCESLADWFTPLGCQVSQAHDGPEGIRLARLLRPDVIVLDILMPVMDGFAVMRALREDETTKQTPIIISSITGTDLQVRLRGLRMGADYILHKTKDLYELEEVVRNRLWRRGAATPAAAGANEGDELFYDANEVAIYRGGRRLDVQLTRREALLMECLWVHRERLVTRDTIIADVYPDSKIADGVTNEAVDRLVGRLRQKLEPDMRAPRYIETVRGHGYRFMPKGTAGSSM